MLDRFAAVHAGPRVAMFTHLLVAVGARRNHLGGNRSRRLNVGSPTLDRIAKGRVHGPAHQGCVFLRSSNVVSSSVDGRQTDQSQDDKKQDRAADDGDS